GAGQQGKPATFLCRDTENQSQSQGQNGDLPVVPATHHFLAETGWQGGGRRADRVYHRAIGH
ncbi:hypothetical protein AZZ66_000293, partial [Escherichia coli]